MPKRGGINTAFKGSVEIVEQLILLGFYFSFGCGIIFRQKFKKKKSIGKVYPERILVETDSPDIPPARSNG
jgi:TatD DNase family protein